jgi:hypothetical protein
MKTKLILIISLFLLLQSCSDTPESVFGKTVLNANTIKGFGSEQFKGMIVGKKMNTMYGKVSDKYEPVDSYELHIKSMLILQYEKYIIDVKSLKSTSDTKELIEKSLNLFNFVKEKYETDYITIAKLLDNNPTESQIDEALKNFDEKNLPKLNQLHQELLEIAVPYAKRNNIEINFY